MNGKSPIYHHFVGHYNSHFVKNKHSKHNQNESFQNILGKDQVMEQVKCDRIIETQPDEDRRRRTIIVERQNGNFGFTLQTYGIKHKKEGEVELITYVDQVDIMGPAFKGGMRPGDVILSINGKDVEKLDHKSLVNIIQSCRTTMRMVVLFEDCVRKVELHIKMIKLKRNLQQKMLEYYVLCQREQQLLQNEKSKHYVKNSKNCTSKKDLVKINWKSLESKLDDNCVNCNNLNIEETQKNDNNQDTVLSTIENIENIPSKGKSKINNFYSKSLPSSVSSSTNCVNELTSTDDRDIITKL